MTAIELKMSLLQEVMPLEDEQLIRAYQGGDLGGAKECPARREGFA